MLRFVDHNLFFKKKKKKRGHFDILVRLDACSWCHSMSFVDFSISLSLWFVIFALGTVHTLCDSFISFSNEIFTYIKKNHNLFCELANISLIMGNQLLKAGIILGMITEFPGLMLLLLLFLFLSDWHISSLMYSGKSIYYDIIGFFEVVIIKFEHNFLH